MKKKFDPSKHCIIKNNKSTKDIFIFHGINSSAKFTMLNYSYLTNLDFNIISCDYRGHGTRKNIGNKTDLKKSLNDIEEFMNSRKTKKILIGQSIGGLMVLNLALKNPLKYDKVIGINAPHNLENNQMNFYLQRKYKNYIEKSKDLSINDSNIKYTTKNIFLIHALKDNVIPIHNFKENKKLFNVPNKNTLLIDSKSSFYMHNKILFNSKTKNFIKNII